MKRIALSRGKFALVDDEDYEYLNQFKWHLSSTGYAVRAMPGKQGEKLAMHRLVCKTPTGKDTDHINGNRSDNRRVNLRAVSHQENRMNSIKRVGVSVYKGVSRHRGKWQVYINYKYIGRFEKEIHAAMAYDIWAKDLHGEFANTNFSSATNRCL